MRIKFHAALLLAAGMSFQAHATNWLQVQGNEVAGAPLVKLSGFVQPTYTYIDAVPIKGLRGATNVNNGEFTVLNLNWPQLKNSDQFQFMRAAVNMRGKLTENINYLIAFDAGQNGTTYYQRPVLTDASITFNAIPGARIRAGLFKVPTSEETLMIVNTSSPYVYNSNAVLYLLVGLPTATSGPANPSGTTPANLIGGFSGFRDWGVQVYDWFNQGSMEFSYAAMLSNGGAIENMQDSDGNKDLTLRLQASKIFGGSGPNREDLSFFMWQQSGKRRFGAQNFDQSRAGIGLKYLQGNYRVSSEYIQADGMIVGGPTPPFFGYPFAVGVNEKSNGWYLEGGLRFYPQWELDLRYDYLNFMTQNAANKRAFATTTFGVQRFIKKNTRAIFNYEWRDMKVSNPGAIPAGAALTNAQTIAGNLGGRISLQITWSF